MAVQSSYLEEPVQRNPEEENISKELHQMKHAVDDPVRQPLCVIIFLLTLNSLDAKQHRQPCYTKYSNQGTPSYLQIKHLLWEKW